MGFQNKVIIFFTTGFYIGHIPYAPGTFGTIPGIFLCYVLSNLYTVAAAVVVAGFIALSIGIAGKSARILGAKDPGCIVIDEIAGMAVTLLWLPFNLYSVVAGFILFRLFDILKPWPVGYLDRNLSGGFGIVMDDVAAGILANIVLRLGAVIFV